MKVNQLLVQLARLNLNAEIIFKKNPKSKLVEIRVDDANVYKQKLISIIVGTQK